ncbi:DUF4476 domain-containing protein [Niabella insulamsoli]|uniref:DUF4476 domain-containing protein n=1 Tax=Niabella insulamsoli TaxID=3144874 RepID=UPI0031FC2E33
MNRHFIFSALLLLVSFVGFGQGYQVQSKYFVYLQTEPAQPFYIKINDQKISANASGYLILPQLKDGGYKLIVGFPDGKVEEQRFDFFIDSKDKGYLIKDYGADGWGLFDLQTMLVQKALKGKEEDKAVAVKKPDPPKEAPRQDPAPASDVSDFTKILSQAANDPSLLEKPKPEPVEEKPVEVAVNDQSAAADPSVAQPETNTAPPQSKPTLHMGAGNGVTIVYDDRNESGQVDPITIFIPAPEKAAQPAATKESKANAASAQAAAKKPEEKPFVVEEKKPIEQNDQPAAASKITNAACKAVASDSDFLKLRRTMASQSNDDQMIAEATKAFDSKCYTTAQVKYLSSMFLSNAGKYNFFAASYSHIADKDNFPSLAAEIKDDAYKSKFQSLIQ